VEKKIFIYGSIIIIASLLFYPLIEFTIKDTLTAIAFAKYGNMETVFLGYANEIILAMMIGFMIALVMTLFFGLSLAFNVWKYEKDLRGMLKNR
jgi:hypothetical protein